MQNVEPVAPQAQCELMPAIVEKTCVSAHEGDQHARLLSLGDDAYKLELKTLEAPYSSVIPVIKKISQGIDLKENERLILQQVDTSLLTPSFALVVNYAQQLDLLQQQFRQLQQENREQEQTLEKQKELIKKLKDISLGR